MEFGKDKKNVRKLSLDLQALSRDLKHAIEGISVGSHDHAKHWTDVPDDNSRSETHGMRSRCGSLSNASDHVLPVSRQRRFSVDSTFPHIQTTGNKVRRGSFDVTADLRNDDIRSNAPSRANVTKFNSISVSNSEFTPPWSHHRRRSFTHIHDELNSVNSHADVRRTPVERHRRASVDVGGLHKCKEENGLQHNGMPVNSKVDMKYKSTDCLVNDNKEPKLPLEWFEFRNKIQKDVMEKMNVRHRPTLMKKTSLDIEEVSEDNESSGDVNTKTCSTQSLESFSDSDSKSPKRSSNEKDASPLCSYTGPLNVQHGSMDNVSVDRGSHYPRDDIINRTRRASTTVLEVQRQNKEHGHTGIHDYPRCSTMNKGLLPLRHEQRGGMHTGKRLATRHDYTGQLCQQLKEIEKELPAQVRLEIIRLRQERQEH